jgi:hypothetical protein
VFGWDDVENAPGIAFVNQLIGGIMNPNGTKASCNLNPNACYGGSALYPCGDGSLINAKASVTEMKFDFANHTIDHLESNSTWSGIPAQYKDPMTGSWKSSDDGFGPGVLMDQATWESILRVNDSELKNVYGANLSIKGFRAPRLELNDHGLAALKTLGYYDQDLEEIMSENEVDAAITIDTAGKKGFNWVPWPYTLDNGSRGIWNQQFAGMAGTILTYPTGVWEVPVYQLYIPSKNGLGKTIADNMLKSDKGCTFPDTVPLDQRSHCFLSEGEIMPGDEMKEVTAFDFNAFIYSRFTAPQWLEIMKHTFLMRYYGNRAPLTYGAHPIEYTAPYDDVTLGTQANNYGFRDVLTYSKWPARQQAMKDFVNWIKADPAFSKDTYFLSAQQLVEYMKAPYNKTGKAVAPNADPVASPDSNALFSRLTWVGDGATITVVDGNSADIVFNSVSITAPVKVSAGLTAGALKGVSHIDIKYNSDVPFRIRLLTSDGTVSMTVLLAGGAGGDHTARIRVKDFFPGSESTPETFTAAGLVNAAYMAKVTGISFESAATQISGSTKTYNTHIKQLTLHGVATPALCTQ